MSAISVFLGCQKDLSDRRDEKCAIFIGKGTSKKILGKHGSTWPDGHANGQSGHGCFDGVAILFFGLVFRAKHCLVPERDHSHVC